MNGTWLETAGHRGLAWRMDQETTPGFLHFRLPDPALVTRTMTEVAERGQRIVTDFLKRQAESEATPDPLNIGGAFFEMTTRLMANPARPMQAQLGFWQDYLTLCQNTARRIMGTVPTPVIAEDPRDRRFKDEAWQENEVFDFIKQSYLLSARFFQTARLLRTHQRAGVLVHDAEVVCEQHVAHLDVAQHPLVVARPPDRAAPERAAPLRVVLLQLLPRRFADGEQLQPLRQKQA